MQVKSLCKFASEIAKQIPNHYLWRMEELLMNDVGKSYGSKLSSDILGILGYSESLLLVGHIFGEHTTG